MQAKKFLFGIFINRVWPSYGPVLAAKAALEAHVRQLAAELAPRGIAVNTIQAGVADTPAARRIPGSDQIFDRAVEMNPGGRLTQPQDVAKIIVVVDAALLIETGGYREYDRLIVVACPPALQLIRLMSRDGLAENEAKARIAAQMPTDEKIRLADYVIDTSGAPERTLEQTDVIRQSAA